MPISGFLRAALAALLLLPGVCAAAGSLRASIVMPTDMPRLPFAAREIVAALEAHDYTVGFASPLGELAAPIDADLVVNFFPADPATLKSSRFAGMNPHSLKIADEGFSLRRWRAQGRLDFWIFSIDEAGAMYGGLELAEQIRLRGIDGVADTDTNPYMPMRGVKFNAPLDLRSPSYSDMSDAGQNNIATMWDFEFWRETLDALARDRYNFISLWNLHPFPSMVKVPEYPKVALNDVWRTQAKFAEDYSTRTIDLLSREMLANKRVVKRLTIDEKIAFWRRVMEYAAERNIDFYLVTWNVYTYGVDGRYGITDSIENPATAAYFRASVREMFRTYPLLRGIGVTAGENMGEVRMYSGGVDSFDAKENWLFETYGRGTLDAARAEPGRRFRLIHRQHESRAQDIVKTFAPVIGQRNVDFLFSFKYAQAHALSSTTQTFHRGYLESLGDRTTLWTIRNDDALLHRWAAPDFVREFVTNIPREKTQGFYYGSDNWVPGRDFLSHDGLAGKPEVEKHWLHWLLWGRLGYDPALGNDRIAELVGARFPGIDGRELLSAWQNASMIYPLVTGFHWADFDFQWYIEACRSRPAPAKTGTGFHSVETFITQPVHPGTDNVTIPAFVAAQLKNERLPGTQPRQVATRIDAHADAAESALEALKRRAGGDSPELAATLSDIAQMAKLGRYYAAKIRGATDLALYRASRDAQYQRRAVEHLEAAALLAGDYAQRATKSYALRIWTNRVGHVDFAEFAAGARADIDIAKAPLEP